MVLLGLDKTKLSADEVAAGQVATSAQAIAEALEIDAAAYVEQAEAAGDKAFVQALVLRAEDATTAVPPRYAEIPGAVSIATQQDLAPSRGFAAPILGSVGEATAEIIEESDGEVEAGDVVGLSGLQARYDDQLSGTPGLTVIAAGADNDRAVHEVPAVAGSAAAHDARHRPADQGRVGARVGRARQRDRGDPSLGRRDPGGGQRAREQGPEHGDLRPVRPRLDLQGRLLAGAAALGAAARPAGAVPRHDGRRRQVVQELRRLPRARASARSRLRQAVANSCNTAFITARDRLGDGDLADAAAALGLGVDHDLGFPAYFGQVPPPETETEAAADLIGQGTVLASPMAMATVAASVAAGRAVLPVLLPDHEVTQTAPAAPLTGRGGRRRCRALMRAVVTEGSGSFLGRPAGGGGRQDRDGGVRLVRRAPARCRPTPG